MSKSNRKSAIVNEEQTRRANLFNSLMEYLECPQWIVPIDSFIDAYCLIFQTGGDLSAESNQEKHRIFQEYKKLVNNMLDQFLKSHDLGRDYLMDVLMHNAHKISEDNFKYILAVEDFDIFKAFMTEKNEEINKQTMQEIQRQKTKQEEALRKVQRAQTLTTLGHTPSIDLSEEEQTVFAIKQSLEEERKRKQLIDSEEMAMLQKAMAENEAELKKQREMQDQEEDEIMRKVMEMSLQMEEERLKMDKLKLEEQLRKAKEEQERLEQMSKIKQEEVAIEQPQLSHRQQTNVRIKQATSKTVRKMHTVIEERIQPTELKQQAILPPTKQLQESVEKKEEQESLEERQRRLKMQRDLLKNKDRENQKPLEIHEVPIYEEKKGNERLARCLNVLREAANEMFNPKTTQDQIEDIDYYENRGDEETKDDNNEDSEIIVLSKGKKPLTNNRGAEGKKKSNQQIIQMEWSDDLEDF